MQSAQAYKSSALSAVSFNLKMLHYTCNSNLIVAIWCILNRSQPIKESDLLDCLKIDLCSADVH